MSTGAIVLLILAYYIANAVIGWCWAYRMKRVTYDYPSMALESVFWFLVVWGVLTLGGRAS
jgi:hypothetical protein